VLYLIGATAGRQQYQQQNGGKTKGHGEGEKRVGASKKVGYRKTKRRQPGHFPKEKPGQQPQTYKLTD
jgi:hypothetical protein